MRMNRRRFLTLAGGGAGALVWARSPRMAAWAQEPMTDANGPDLVVVNAKIYTMDARLPGAEAFAIRGGRFQAIGSSADIRNLARRATPVFDAQQMTIVLGFIDCHNHAEGEVLLYEVLVGDPFQVKYATIGSIIEKLRKKADEIPPGTWVEGYFFDDTKVSDKHQLNVHDLDQISRQHPVVLHHRGGHTGFYNSKALQLAGITKDTPNPAGGTFDRDKNGDLSGRVSDNAMDVFDKVGVRPVYTPAFKAQRRRDAMAYISRQFVRYGLTSVHHDDAENLLAVDAIGKHGFIRQAARGHRYVAEIRRGYAVIRLLSATFGGDRRPVHARGRLRARGLRANRIRKW